MGVIIKIKEQMNFSFKSSIACLLLFMRGAQS